MKKMNYETPDAELFLYRETDILRTSLVALEHDGNVDGVPEIDWKS